MLEQHDLCDFASLQEACSSDDWVQLSMPEGAKRKIRSYVKSRLLEREAGSSGNKRIRPSREMLYDFFVGPDQGHKVFSELMMGIVGLSHTAVITTLQLKEARSCSYLMNHMVQHLVSGGHVQVAQTLLLQLPWLLECLEHRRRGVWDVLSDMKCAVPFNSHMNSSY